MNNINCVAENQCVGCGVCFKLCPHSAIRLFDDNLGFKRPSLNEKQCIECGLCIKKCAAQHDSVLSYPRASYAVSLRNTEFLKKSSSGGAFWGIASAFVKKGGLVVGAKLFYENGLFFCKHIICSNEAELALVQGSKYFQSDSWSVFPEIKQLLQKNKILFSGTACQIAALKKYIGENDNLFTVEILCHGVPSEKMFNDFINFQNKKVEGKIVNYFFRDKEKFCGYEAKIIFEKKGKMYSKFIPSTLNSFTYFFLKGALMRPSCYSCQFSNEKRIGDVTVGDFWGVERNCPELLLDGVFSPKKGISFLLVNSSKGYDLLVMGKDNLNVKEVDYDAIKKGNSQFSNPCVPFVEREKVLQIYRNEGWYGVDKFFHKLLGMKFFWFKVMSLIPYTIRLKIKFFFAKFR